MSTHLDPSFLQARAEGDSTLAVVIPEKIHSLNADIIGRQLNRLAEQAQRLDLDMGNVGYVDSLGLAKLVGVHKKLRASGGTFRLLNVNPFVHEVFVLTKLDKLLDVQPKAA